MPRTALVIPTIRPASFQSFLAEWEGAPWDDLIVVYDGPRSECRLEAGSGRVYCWDDYEELYGSHAGIFSRRDSACRCFGFLQAVARGAEAVITLDDDCYPTGRWGPAEFVRAHRQRLGAAPRWVSSVPGLSVRGLPGPSDELARGGPPVMVNMGLWCGVPDLSAAETVALQGRGELAQALLSEFVPPSGSRVMSPHQLFPFSGMNFAFRRSALPALYFPRMGDGSLYSRFDDIWCGLLLQRILEASGDLITVGEPWVRHARASDVSANLRKEAPGTAVNARFWRILADLPVQGEGVAECADSAAHALARCDEPFLASWGRALAVWVSLCRVALAAPRSASGPGSAGAGLPGAQAGS